MKVVLLSDVFQFLSLSLFENNIFNCELIKGLRVLFAHKIEKDSQIKRLE